jgi:hypothetical protein
MYLPPLSISSPVEGGEPVSKTLQHFFGTFFKCELLIKYRKVIYAFMQCHICHLVI